MDTDKSLEDFYNNLVGTEIGMAINSAYVADDDVWLTTGSVKYMITRNGQDWGMGLIAQSVEHVNRDQSVFEFFQALAMQLADPTFKAGLYESTLESEESGRGRSIEEF